MHNLLALIGNSLIYFNIQSLVHLALAYIISFAIIYPTYPISIYTSIQICCFSQAFQTTALLVHVHVL